jgi:hypothetical protein
MRMHFNGSGLDFDVLRRLDSRKRAAVPPASEDSRTFLGDFHLAKAMYPNRQDIPIELTRAGIAGQILYHVQH